MDIRLGRLKMAIENSLGYYELPSGNASDTTQPSSSVPSEKPLASKILTEAGNNCQTEQCKSPDTKNEATRYSKLKKECFCTQMIAGRLRQLLWKREQAQSQAQFLTRRLVSRWTSRKKRRRRRTGLIFGTKSGTPSEMTVTLTEEEDHCKNFLPNRVKGILFV